MTVLIKDINSESKTENYFELFNLPTKFEIDGKSLDKEYRQLQQGSHPDRYVNESSAVQLHAVQQTANNAEAYQNLKSPVKRACHLLTLLGEPFDLNSYTVKDIDLLMQQMFYREELSDIDQSADLKELEKFNIKVKSLTKETEQLIAQLFNTENLQDYVALKNNICELQFLNKLALDLDEVEEHLMFQD